MKTNNAEDAKKAHKSLVIKEFLKVEKIVPKEQSFKQEQELVNSITKKEESDSSNKNAAILCIKSSLENQIESSKQEAGIFEKEVQTVKNNSYSSIQTDVSGCVSTVSKKNDKEFPSTKNKAELITLYSLLILFSYSSFLFNFKVLSRYLIFKLYFCL